jgi:hypothetical protein
MKEKKIPNKDAFGRFETQEEGSVYQITNGRPFLFCGTDIFAEERLKPVFNLMHAYFCCVPCFIFKS